MKLDDQFWGNDIVALLVPRRRAPVSTFDPVQLETQYTVLHAPGRGEPSRLTCWSCRNWLLNVPIDGVPDPFPAATGSAACVDEETTDMARFVCVTCGIGVLVTW